MKKTKRVGLEKSGHHHRQFCFFNYKTLQNKHNIRTLSGNIKTVRNSFSERVLFNAKSAIV
jgi:hypothetical protein